MSNSLKQKIVSQKFNYIQKFHSNLFLNAGLIIDYATDHLTEILRNDYAQVERSVFLTSVYLPVYFHSHEVRAPVS